MEDVAISHPTPSLFHGVPSAFFLMAAAATVVVAPPSGGAGTARTIDVFVLAGQSNLAGRAPGDGLPQALAEPPRNVRFDYICSFGARGTGGPPEPHASAGWVPLLPSPKHASTPGTHFGPEIGFGHALAAAWPDRSVAIIKNGRGATSLAEDWDPVAVSGPRLYAQMLAQVRARTADLSGAGMAPRMRAFVWCQGEADSTRREWAEAYAANLDRFIRHVRRDFADPTLPVIVVLTGDGRKNEKMRYAEVVRDAQRSWIEGDRHASLVTADDLDLIDVVHFDARSQVEIGERIARACLRLLEQGRDPHAGDAERIGHGRGENRWTAP